MIPILQTSTPADKQKVDGLINKLRLDPAELALNRGELAKHSAAVAAIMADVAARGDAAVVESCRKFDDPDFTADQIRVSKDEVKAAHSRTPADQLAAIRRSIAQVREYQQHVMPRGIDPLHRPGSLPALPARIQPGLPIELLRRRPDVAEAERQLASATAQVGVATAQLFPQVVVTGGLGAQQGRGATAAAINPIWSLGPAVAVPLLDFGRLDAAVERADFRSRELLFNYKQTVLNAVREVDTAVGAYAAQQERLRYLSGALAAARRAVNLAEQRFERGLTDSLNVIDAQRQAYELEQQYVTAQASAAIGQSKLMRAWETAFARYKLNVAQLLLTYSDLDSYVRRANAGNTLERLLSAANVVPIINENDSVATEELSFGDNDRLSAEVAMLAGADLLIILTGVDGLLDANGNVIPRVRDVDGAKRLANGSKGRFSVGGMISKLEAVKMAVHAGIMTVIINGRHPERIAAAVAGQVTGTRFIARKRPVLTLRGR